MVDITSIITNLDQLDKWFDKPEKWTQGAFGMNAHSELIMVIQPWVTDPPVSCCLLGAIMHNIPDLKERNVLELAMTRYIKNSNKTPILNNAANIVEFNDNHNTTFSDIKELINSMREDVKKNPSCID